GSRALLSRLGSCYLCKISAVQGEQRLCWLALTLIVGIQCSNGVVVAADQQATHGALGAATVGQAITKVRIVGPDTLFAASGHAGLGQQVAAVIDRKRKDFANWPYSAVIKDVQKEFREIINPAFESARLAAQVYGPQAAQEQAVCGSLLAAPFKDGLHLIEI